MDDIRMVRELFGEPSPAPELEKSLRAKLAELENRRRLPRPGRRATFAFSAVAAAAAATLAIATLGGGPSTGHPVATGSTPAPELTARTILLAAANEAAKEPIGRYWHLHTISGQSYHVGPVDGGYTVVGARSENDTWTARSLKEPDQYYIRKLGAAPLTPADEAAWRKAGSPKVWLVWSDGNYTKLISGSGSGSGKWESVPSSMADKRKRLMEMMQRCGFDGARDLPTPPAAPISPSRPQGCAAQLTWAERERLASDPDQFEKLLKDRETTARAEGLGSASTVMATYDLLIKDAVSPAVRARAFQLLAGLQGLRSIGTLKDAKGRAGVGVATRTTTEAGDGTVFDLQLIFDPKTYRLLGEQRVVVEAGDSYRGMRPGTVLYHEVVLNAGWTDESPRHP